METPKHYLKFEFCENCKRKPHVYWQKLLWNDQMYPCKRCARIAGGNQPETATLFESVN